MGHPPRNGRLPRIVGSPKAELGLAELTRERGPQVIVLSGPCVILSVAAARGRRGFVPNEHQVLVDQVARCPVYADLQHITMCPHEVIVLDLGWRSGTANGERAFVTRPESPAERQQRVFSARARGEDP
jgi:uncharacterized protein (DUF779 family)